LNILKFSSAAFVLILFFLNKREQLENCGSFIPNIAVTTALGQYSQWNGFPTY